MIPQATEWTEDGALVPVTVDRRALPRKAVDIAPHLEREQRPLQPGAGKLEAIVPIRTLVRKLGATTYRLWATLLTMRDPTAETHPSFNGLVKAAHMGRAQVAKSMARLREFKLVEDFGFIYRRVPCRCRPEIGCTGHKVYIRNVYGQVRQTESERFVAAVPSETLKLVMAAAGQGGKRKGAGRPRKAGTDAPKEQKREVASPKQKKSKVVAYKYQELDSQKSLTALPRNGKLHSECESGVRGGGNDQRKREALAKFLSSPPFGALLVPPLQPKAQPAPSAAAGEARDAAPAASAKVASAAQGAPESEVFVASDDSKVLIDGVEHTGLGAIFAAGGAREIGMSGTPGPRQRFTPDDMRATTQLSSQIVHLRVPAPPKVREEHTDEERLAMLKAAYRAAHERTLRTDYWRPRKEQTEKERVSFLSAAHSLMDVGISPAAWALHAFGMWLRVGNKKTPLPSWVWNSVRIHEHAAWCRDAVGYLDGGPAEALPATKELYRRLALLQRKLGWGRPTDVVLSEVLPEAERATLLKQQAHQLVEWKKSIQQRIRNGEWVWG